MGFLKILLIAFALALDSFAVSIVYGFDLEYIHPRNMVSVAALFGLLQGMMPLMGWLAGRGFYKWISPVDHWVVFAILGGLGVKMIIESFHSQENTKVINYSTGMLVMLGVATSIDALAVGISLALLDVMIVIPIAVIGLVTFIMALTGRYIGRLFGKVFKGYVNIAGGLILIFIGAKVLLSHLKGM